MPTQPDGSFKRAAAAFRNTVKIGSRFAPEKNRYHLYVSYACPWATRTLIVRKLKGLDDVISVTVVSPRMGVHGWAFGNVDPFPRAEPDPLYGFSYMKELYLKADPNYTGRFTVPVLWDKKLRTIVNNESSEIIRMFNSEFNELLEPEYARRAYYPHELRETIDLVNTWVYDDINNGVYRAGFATTQEAYEKAVRELFAGLDKVENILKGQKYLVGGRMTEADIRLWVTIVRFDPVYVGHFKCNLRTIRQGYPNIDRWLRDLYYNFPAFRESTDFEHIKTHYYWSHTSINPTRVVPAGPIPHIGESIGDEQGKL